MENQIDQAISTSDYMALFRIFNTTWQSLGQGEQRTLSAYFIKAALNTPNFLPKAFESSDVVSVMKTALGRLPPTVENAMDNKLRHLLFTHLVEEEEDYRAAANILAGTRMEEDDETNMYYTSNAERTDVYVKIAECFLNEEDYVEAETFVTRAGSSVESITNPEEHVALILRFKSTYARVLDANRKFLPAASRYYDLSQLGNQAESMDMIDTDDLLEFLGRAATCAILARSGSQRQRILGLVFKDERLSQLDSLPHFKTHSSIVTKMYMNQIIVRGDDFIQFQNSLGDHQKALKSDGLTIEQSALIEHNMVAVSRLYTSIYLTDLGKLLGVSTDRAEKIACKMIMAGTLAGGSIDEVDGVLNFDMHERELVNWDVAITSFCSQLNKVTDAVRLHT
jgi:COP9 signalosome complex subunit 4